MPPYSLIFRIAQQQLESTPSLRRIFRKSCFATFSCPGLPSRLIAVKSFSRQPVFLHTRHLLNLRFHVIVQVSWSYQCRPRHAVSWVSSSFIIFSCTRTLEVTIVKKNSMIITNSFSLIFLILPLGVPRALVLTSLPTAPDRLSVFLPQPKCLTSFGHRRCNHKGLRSRSDPRPRHAHLVTGLKRRSPARSGDIPLWP